MVRKRTRLRVAIVLVLLAVFAAALAATSLIDPFHLRHARWFTAGSVLLALLLGVAALTVAVPGRVLRAVVLVLGAVAVGGWIAIVIVASGLDRESRIVQQVDGPESGRRLVVLEGGDPIAGPSYAVVLRAGSGLFEQETVIYQGVRTAPPPSEVRFVDAATVEVLVGSSCRYRSRADDVTLAVDVVHRALQAGAC